MNGFRATYADKLTLRRVRLNAGGYDQDGAYWGVDQPLYYYSNESGAVAGHVRGATRDGAKEAVRVKYPNVWFYR